MIKTCTYL